MTTTQAGTFSRPGAATHAGRRRPGRERLCARSAALALLMATSGPALGLETAGKLDAVTVEICLTIPEDSAAFEASLHLLGWQAQEQAALSGTTRRGLAIDQFAARMCCGDAPEIRWQSAWESAQAYAEGLARQASVPDAPARKSYLESDGGSVLRVEYWQGNAGRLSLQCTIILSPADMAQTLQGIADSGTRFPKTSPILASAPANSSEDKQATRKTYLHLIDQDRFTAKTGTEPGIAGIVDTILRTRRPTD